ncbi:hypothetical protein CapIbe_012425 [Capra ibex]
MSKTALVRVLTDHSFKHKEHKKASQVCPLLLLPPHCTCTCAPGTRCYFYEISQVCDRTLLEIPTMQEEKGMTEDEMVGWHHQLNGHAFDSRSAAGHW